MTPEQVALVVESWERAKTGGLGDAILERFYERLFLIDPGAHALFAGTNMVAQRQKFGGMIEAILALRSEPRLFVHSAAELGRRHVQYGVRSEQYESAGIALLAALRDIFGAQFTPELRETWASAYKLVAAIMIRAADRTRATPRGKIARA